MNHHLNLFRFFNEPNSNEFLENNLSRALSIILLNSPLFLNEFVKNVVDEEDYQYLFSYVSKEEIFSIDVQVDITRIQNESYKKVYAIALTANKNIDFSNFKTLTQTSPNNITDVVITVKDIAFIIEVKRTNEDCKQQLFNQIYPFLNRKNEEPLNVIPICLSWHKIVTTMERVNNIEKLISNDSLFIKDFLDLAEARYPYWFEPKPFNNLKFSDRWGTAEHHYLMQRLKQGLVQSGYDLLPYADRLGLIAPFGWASEIIPQFHHYHDDKLKDYIAFYIWPGNTKTQGYHIFNKSLDWTKKTSLAIDDKEYELEVIYDIKISHFNRYVTNFIFGDSDLKKPLHTKENFYGKSGKWNIDLWPEFEDFLDDHFKETYNWREKAKWEEKIINTDRNYFTMALGYEVSLFIPYQELCNMDKRDEDIIHVGNKIQLVVESFNTLLDG